MDRLSIKHYLWINYYFRMGIWILVQILCINMHDLWINYWDGMKVWIKALILSIEMD